MLISVVKGYPALLVRHEKALVVGDLHIGLDLKYRQSGIHFQKATERLAKKLIDAYKEANADSVILLGDVKESIAAPKFGEYRELRIFFDALNGINVRVTAGNHDGGLRKALDSIGYSTRVEKEILLGGAALMHGNRWPSPEAMQCKYIVVGHAHYALRKNDQMRKIWLVSNVSKQANGIYRGYNKKIKLVVAPAFNDLITGSALSRTAKEYLPLTKNGIFEFEDAEIYGLDGKSEGKVKDSLSM